MLEWLDEQPRSYAETLDAWKTSCPRLSIWEDALADRLIRIEAGRVHLTPAGRALLDLKDEANASCARRGAVPTLEPPRTKGARQWPRSRRRRRQAAATSVPVTDRNNDVDGYRIGFTEFRQDIDATPLMDGLPDGMCQCPHWGYVLAGKVTFRFADRDETTRRATRSTRRPATSRSSTSPAASS